MLANFLNAQGKFQRQGKPLQNYTQGNKLSKDVISSKLHCSLINLMFTKHATFNLCN